MNVQSSPFRVLCGKKYTDFKKYIIVVVAVVTNIRYAWPTNQKSDRFLVVPWYGASVQVFLRGSPRGFALAQYHDRFSVQELLGGSPFNVSWDSPRNVTGAAPGMTSEPPRNPMVDTAFSFDESENV